MSEISEEEIKNSKMQAKKCLHRQIKFFKSLIAHIDKNEEPWCSRACFSAWILQRYIEDRMIDDIEKSISEFEDKNEH